MPATEKSQSNGGFRAEELGRRDFQKQTAAIIDRHAHAIHQLQTKLKANSEFMADMSTRIDQHSTDLANCISETRWQGELRALIAEQNICTLFMLRSFAGRLRWLFLGR